MAGVIYFRDPRNIREVFGPFPVEQLPEFVKQGRLRALDQVSFDELTWITASDLKPPLFAAGPGNWLAGNPAWKQTATQAAAQAGARLKMASQATWSYLRRVTDFYWSQRKEMRQAAVEYLPFLQDPGARREIRVTADEHNDAVAFEDNQWRADLPDCCIVCGEPAQGDWNREQRSIPDLTWPFLSPVFGFLLGIAGWLILWNTEGRWLIPLGLFAGFLVGYGLRREAIVVARFRRCREHLNRTRIPSFRIFRKTLIIGIGDRKVWRLFHHPERTMETPLSVPPDFSRVVESTQPASGPHDSGPSYPTIPLVDDSEMDPDGGSIHPAM